MKQLLAVCLVLVFAVTAFAGDNPQVYAYISFDPAGDEAQNAVSPTPYTTVDGYVCLGCIQGGMTTLSFRLNDVVSGCPGVMATQAFVNLLPGGLMIGDPFAGGATIASTMCMIMDPVVVGYGSYFYLGGACCIEILDHVDYPRWVVDCQDPGQVDLYCLQGHGIVAGGTCVTPTDYPCPCGSAVEDATWGGIKALYR
ncbi:MAG: hypothetical protein IMY84_00690 [Chloroflexi bacterium]|nr:hypothetical protein [Chloroflexota bacterium]